MEAATFFFRSSRLPRTHCSFLLSLLIFQWALYPSENTSPARALAPTYKGTGTRAHAPVSRLFFFTRVILSAAARIPFSRTRYALYFAQSVRPAQTPSGAFTRAHASFFCYSLRIFSFFFCRLWIFCSRSARRDAWRCDFPAECGNARIFKFTN